MKRTCPECGRVFDLLDPVDAEEAAYGHDCEVLDPQSTDAASTPTPEVHPEATHTEPVAMAADAVPVIHELAVATDTAIADAYERLDDVQRHIGWSIGRVHQAVDKRVRPGGFGTDSRWELSDEDAITEARRRAAAADLGTTYPETYDATFWENRKAHEIVEELDGRLVSQAAIIAELRPLEDTFREHRWSRFFLVDNAGGHIHKDRSCSTCFPTTQYGWLPQLSGLDEAAAVKDQGPRLCSVCFPSAPVEWTLGLPKSPKCPGSGQRAVIAEGRRFARYGRCPVCNQSFAINQSTGAIRAHKPAKES